MMATILQPTGVRGVYSLTSSDCEEIIEQLVEQI